MVRQAHHERKRTVDFFPTQKNRGTEVPPFLSRLAFFGSFTAPVAVPLMGLLAVVMKSRFEYEKTSLCHYFRGKTRFV
jgi:hypothetical protein